ncbi:MAG: hypothetical protein QM718_06970 [Steroidobacteraceae bacterium]
MSAPPIRPPLPELALSADEVERILEHCDGQALLVGGQSLAFWVQRYELPRPEVLAMAVSNDVDFLGSSRVARALHRSLAGGDWKLWEPRMDDSTNQTAKLSQSLPEGIKQIDFLDSLIGMSSADIQSRAVELTLPNGKRLRIMHPLDVLESRLRNLASLPAKRNAQGIEQGRLAIEVVRHYVREMLAAGRPRDVFEAAERLHEMAGDRRLLGVHFDYALDPLEAMPSDQVPHESFRSERWPRIKAEVAKRRASYAKRRNR